MRLFLLAIGDRTRASSRLRVWDHAEWCRSEGHEVFPDCIVPPGVRGWRLLGRIMLRLPAWVAHFFRADRILLQETLVLAPLLPFRNLGKSRRVIYDFSDPVDLLGHGLRNRLQRLGFGLMTKLADHLVFENGRYWQSLVHRAPQLTQFYGPVDYARYQQGRAQLPAGAAAQPVRLGWTGSPGTLALIQPMFPALARLLQDGKVSLTLMGLPHAPPELAHLPVTVLPWEEALEFQTVPAFDLGLFALDDSAHSQYRGAGKLFIYMAAGVPFVASDTGIARELMDATGIGFRVRHNDWETGLADALAQPHLWRQYSDHGMRIAHDTFSYERYREFLRQQFGPVA